MDGLVPSQKGFIERDDGESGKGPDSILFVEAMANDNTFTSVKGRSSAQV